MILFRESFSFIGLSTTLIFIALSFDIACSAPSVSMSIASTNCQVPPQFWCENEIIAKECNVLGQCLRTGFLTQPVADAKPVQFALYYESLCPDCKQFFAQMLNPSYQKLSSIMELILVPYGNALEKKVGHHWEFQCQHGREECEGNIIETCAIDVVKNISVYFPFINCMEASHSAPAEAAKECSAKFPVPLDKIIACSNSSMGNKLEHEMAVKTDALSPKHDYVPWVTLNGVHTDKIQNKAMSNLVELICDAYKGKKPPACESTYRHL